jgi:hypothetical protein
MKLGAKALEQAWLRCAFNIAAVNCDDHTKNLAFLMEPSGAWRLSPAFDTCFAHTPLPGKWTRQHQMLVGGKGWNITDEDLIALAKTFHVRRPHLLLERVIDAVNRWPQYGRKAGVPIKQIKLIAGYHPEWVRLPRKHVAAAKRPSLATKQTARASRAREEDDEECSGPKARLSGNGPGQGTARSAAPEVRVQRPVMPR